MSRQQSLKEVREDLGVPAALLKIIGVALIISVFGFCAMAKNLWMDNWFWTPLTYACAATAWVSIVIMLGFMLVKESRDLRKAKEHY
jgi:hypothetical protein